MVLSWPRVLRISKFVCVFKKDLDRLERKAYEVLKIKVSQKCSLKSLKYYFLS